MTTILLQFKHNNGGMKPRRYTVVSDMGDTLDISYTTKFRDKSESTQTYTITRQADGSWRNQNGCEYVQAKADRRAKPYSIEYRSGIGEGKSVEEFATIAEVREYVKGRWQGVEYIDSLTCFHNDFGHFYLKNCSLSDLGQRASNDASTDEYWMWMWHQQEAA